MNKSLLLALLLGTTSTAVFAQEDAINSQCKGFMRSAPQQVFYNQTPLLSKYDVGYVHLDVKLETSNTYIEGNALSKITILQSTDTIAFELLQEITVDSAFVNGVVVPFTHFNDVVNLISPGKLPNQIVTTKIYYHGTAPDNGFFSGLSSKASQSWGNRATWSLSESFHARDWWPSKQVLPDRIDSSDVWITTNNANKAGSNGMLVKVTPMPNNKSRYEWHNNRNINYYLISVAVAQYIEYNTYAHPAGLQDSILIQNYIYNNPNTLPNFKTSIDKTGRYIEEFSYLFGLYPYYKQKYGHCMAPLSGGEEHQTMTTIGFFNDDLVDHELGHQWWGDNVTCATWQDIFINEGFASYCEVLGIERTEAHTAVVTKLSSVHNSIMGSPGGSVYIPFAEAGDENRIFDSRLSYDKGSAIIHMMRFEAENDSLFFAALKKMQIDFSDSVATGEDLKTILNQVTGKNYQVFFNQWYYGQGYPSFKFDWYAQNDTLYIQSKQTASFPNATPLFQMLMDFSVTTNNGKVVFRPRQTTTNDLFKMPLNGKTVSALSFNPDKWLLAKQTSITHVVTGNIIPEQSLVQLFPNPASNYFTVNFNYQVNGTLTLSDLSGRLVKEQFINDTSAEVLVSNLEPGIYFVTIRSADGWLTTVKFTKE